MSLHLLTSNNHTTVFHSVNRLSIGKIDFLRSFSRASLCEFSDIQFRNNSWFEFHGELNGDMKLVFSRRSKCSSACGCYYQWLVTVVWFIFKHQALEISLKCETEARIVKNNIIEIEKTIPNSR